VCVSPPLFRRVTFFREFTMTHENLAKPLLILACGLLLPLALAAAPAPSDRAGPAPFPASPATRTARGGTSRGMSAPAVPLAPGEGPTCPFDATIYELVLPPAQIGRLDADGLTRAAATPEAFEKALAALGEAKPLYRVNQAVRLANDAITIGAQVPYITNSQVTSRGESINTVAYTSVGAVFNLAGKTDDKGAIALDLSVQVSGLSEGAVTISAAVKAPAFRVTQMSYKGSATPRQPFVVISVDASTTDANGKAVAYLARITLGEPQTATAAAASGAAHQTR
jgi:hypothetical protein